MSTAGSKIQLTTAHNRERSNHDDRLVGVRGLDDASGAPPTDECSKNGPTNQHCLSAYSDCTTAPRMACNEAGIARQRWSAVLRFAWPPPNVLPRSTQPRLPPESQSGDSADFVAQSKRFSKFLRL